MHCPRCNAIMILELEGLHEDIPVHRCDRCLALWMSPESLDRLDENINVDAAKLDWQPTGADEFACTVCPAGYRSEGTLLTAQTLADAQTLVLHRCPHCSGLLLDPATLDRIQAVVVRG
jgi:Zn-finger nucleic acid-binding protein